MKRIASALVRASLGLSLVVASIGCTTEPPPPPPQMPHAALADASRAKPFVGTWRLVDRNSQSAAVTAAIERVVSQMNGLVRGIARDRLTEANTLPQKLEVKAGDDLVAISLDGKTSSAPTDGRVVKQTVVTGETMDVAVKVGDSLEESFRGDGKGRVNTFELQGNTLVMHVRIYSDQLPEDVVYDLHFERIG
jgi:hypothetical protein